MPSGKKSSSPSSSLSAITAGELVLPPLRWLLLRVARDRVCLTLSSSSISVSSSFLFFLLPAAASSSLSARASSSAFGLAYWKRITTSRTAIFGANLSLEHPVLQLGHFPSEVMHLRIHIEQNVWLQGVMTGLL